MGSTIVAIGTAILGAGASTVAAGTVGALAVGAATYGAVSLGSSLAGDVNMPSPVAPPTDKTMPQARDELDAPLIADEKSKKRKKATAKSRFKIDKGPAETGLATPETDRVTGVQL